MFEKISLEEAYLKNMDYTRRILEFSENGANPLGSNPIDLKYSNLLEESAQYNMQFDNDELLAILKKVLEGENEQKNREIFINHHYLMTK